MTLLKHVPFGLSVEECARRMDVHHLAVDERAVPLLGVFLCGVSEEAGANCLLNSRRVLAS